MNGFLSKCFFKTTVTQKASHANPKPSHSASPCVLNSPSRMRTDLIGSAPDLASMWAGLVDNTKAPSLWDLTRALTYVGERCDAGAKV